MPRQDSRKRLTQAVDTVSDLNTMGLDAHKKPRMVDDGSSIGEYLYSTSVHNASPQTHFIGQTATQTYHRSSRANKGHGGQMAQLQNIERIQTESTTASKIVLPQLG